MAQTINSPLSMLNVYIHNCKTKVSWLESNEKIEHHEYTNTFAKFEK